MGLLDLFRKPKKEIVTQEPSILNEDYRHYRDDANKLDETEPFEITYNFKGEYDDMLPSAIEFALTTRVMSTSMLQRKLKLGYARASRIIDDMENMGIVGAFKGSAPRDVLVTRSQLRNFDFSRFTLWEIQEQESIFNKHYDNMDGHEFERFCANLLKKNGFANVEVTSGSGDYGVDVLANKDGVTYAIQCKCYSSNIGNKAVQEIYSGKDFYKRHVGVVMTNQYFTSSAIETAKRTGIVLWDREQLEKMIK